jgi:hypothetical protein
MQEAGFDLRVPDVEDFVARNRVFPFTHAASGLVVPVIAPEELIVTKILAGRPKDLEDVQGIVRAQGEALDLARIRDLLGQLEAAIHQADLLPALEEQLRVARRQS